MPLWSEWDYQACHDWITDTRYDDPKYGDHSRPGWGSYAQDSVSIFEQKTIEGHAVRATLMATGIATAALENHNPDYIHAAKSLWDNMAGKRMYITGRVGAFHRDEKFGPDYYLTNDGYLETCAAVGAGFFSQRMNELTAMGKYMDEFERVLYNNILTGVSLSGTKYTYVNMLNSDHHHRWDWHGCPCCPPMFLKIMSALPSSVYSYKPGEIYVNLFIGSETNFRLENGKGVQISQSAHYPWDGKISVTIHPDLPQKFTLNLRVPGWALGIENAYGLYLSSVKQPVELLVNGEPADLNIINGYAAITKKWEGGDEVELHLPIEPRFVYGHDSIEAVQGRVSIASGPLVYCLEEYDNPGVTDIKMDPETPLKMKYESRVLDGVNVITGNALKGNSEEVIFKAIPYYAAGNNQPENAYRVWIPVR